MIGQLVVEAEHCLYLKIQQSTLCGGKILEFQLIPIKEEIGKIETVSFKYLQAIVSSTSVYIYCYLRNSLSFHLPK